MVRSRARVGVSLGLLLSVVSLVLTGMIYQVLASQRDRRLYRRPNELADAGGHLVHLRISGREQEGPTVVLENGLGFPSLTWTWVLREVAPHVRIVAYDRAGIGWSEPGPQPRSAQRVVDELRSALIAAEVGGPYVLVAHSLGGLYARVFADRYPEEVVGMVLVDSAHPDELERSPQQRKGLRQVELGVGLSSVLARVGALRLGFLGMEWIRKFPPEQAAEVRSLLSLPSTWAATRAELSVWEQLTNKEARQTRSLGDIPLIVLTASETMTSDPVHGQLQAELAALSSNSMHRSVLGASHESILLDQEHARTVAASIRQVVDAARSPGTLIRPA
jgi:pimeloyl-ACP methyl ester carboxylesterase